MNEKKIGIKVSLIIWKELFKCLCFVFCLFYSNCTWLIHLRFSYFSCALNLLNYFNILMNVYIRYSPKHTQVCFESSINTKALCCWFLWYMLTSSQSPFLISPVELLFKYPFYYPNKTLFNFQLNPSKWSFIMFKFRFLKFCFQCCKKTFRYMI